MLMTDGKYYVEIELKVWESFDIGYSEDLSEEILTPYANGFFVLDDETWIYIVDNVNAITDIALAWKLNTNDFENDTTDILDKRMWYTFKSITPIRKEIHIRCK